MRNVDFMILTRDNVEEYFKKIEATGDPIVIFGLTAQDYEYLSLNFADVLELLDPTKFCYRCLQKILRTNR